MIKTLKKSISHAVSSADTRKLTIFKIRFPKELFDGKEYTIKLNFSDNSVIYWGDGSVTNQPNSPIEKGFTHSHTYEKELVDQEQTITVICEGYPQYNEYSSNDARSPFDSNVLCEIECLSKYTQSANSLFISCKQLKSISEHLFDGTKITNFDDCFARSGLTYIPEKLFDSAEKYATFSGAFYFCEDLTESDLVFGGPNSLTFNMFKQIFMYCTKLKSVNKDMFKYVSNDACLRSAFLSCYKISIPRTFFDRQTHSTFDNTFCMCHLTADDFLGPKKRIPLDLFATNVTQIEQSPDDSVRQIFTDVVRPEDTEDFKKAAAQYPDAFKIQYGPFKVQLDKLDIYDEV